MQIHSLIERNSSILLGKPVIKGTRISVELIMRKLASGYTFSDLLLAYPHLTTEQLSAACEYAADSVFEKFAGCLLLNNVPTVQECDARNDH